MAKDLIGKLLKVSPEERISAEEILKHPWLQVSDQEYVRTAVSGYVSGHADDQAGECLDGHAVEGQEEAGGGSGGRASV